MTKVLVIGGTRFFGKNLVHLLIEQPDVQVTVLTRGQSKDDFGDRIHRLVADRSNAAALEDTLQGLTFDVVYDNVCFTPQEAKDACRLFAERTRRYIFTSSLSVYPFGPGTLHEEDVDTAHYSITDDPEAKFDYAEGKRQAEAVFFQQASFPAVAVRFPIVFGPNDYTKRLHEHVRRIQNGEIIGMPNLSAKMNFIHEQEAAEFLLWLGTSELTGPVNARSTGEMTLQEVVDLIEQTTGRKAIIQSEVENPADHSSIGVPDSWSMDTSKASNAGFQFYQLSEWFPALVREIAAENEQVTK